MHRNNGPITNKVNLTHSVEGADIHHMYILFFRIPTEKQGS